MQIEFDTEIKKIINTDDKQWNIHMLRMCAKTLCNLSKQDFKRKRWTATVTNNPKLEKKILEQMLCDRAKQLNSDEYKMFNKRVNEFESKRLLHPRHKYIDY